MGKVGEEQSMRKALKWIGIVLGGLVGLIVVVVIGLLIYGQVSFKRTLQRPVHEIAADTSPEGVARGEYLVRTVIGCGQCHSPDGEQGALIGMVENINLGPISGVFATPNLTPDKDTGLGAWTDGEIARAIREGLDKDGVELVVMPASQFHHLSDEDVAAIVGYLRSLEPVKNNIPPFQLSALGKGLAAVGLFGPSEVGEPITAPQTAPEPGATDAERGEYLVTLGGCRFCHGENLAGGSVPFSEPGAAPAANLTPAGEVAGWSETNFIETLRTGVNPADHHLDDSMPWKRLGKLTDEDLKALWAYLQSVPAATPKK
jgi:mono/diheme cytochrome c family protein